MRTAIVLACGLVTTVLSLALNEVAAQHGLHLVSWYVAFIVPFGSLLVGLGASLGFGLGSWLSGRRLDATLAMVIVALLVVAYFGAEYGSFRVEYPHGVVDDAGAPLAFWGYFDASTRLITFNHSRPLGLFGYAFRLAELGAFSLGGLLGTHAMLHRRPHCARCERYQRVVPLTLVAMDDPLDRFVEATQDGRRLQREATAMRVQQKALEQHDERRSLLVVHCPSCGEGVLRVDAVAGLPEQRVGLPLVAHPMSKVAVDDFVRARQSA